MKKLVMILSLVAMSMLLIGSLAWAQEPMCKMHQAGKAEVAAPAPEKTEKGAVADDPKEPGKPGCPMHSGKMSEGGKPCCGMHGGQMAGAEKSGCGMHCCCGIASGKMEGCGKPCCGMHGGMMQGCGPMAGGMPNIMMFKSGPGAIMHGGEMGGCGMMPGAMMRGEMGGGCCEEHGEGPMHGSGCMHMGGMMDPVMKQICESGCPQQILGMGEMLGLSEEQSDKVKALGEEFHKFIIKKKADLEVANIELRELLGAAGPDFGQVDRKVGEIAALERELRLEMLRMVAASRGVLTAEQVKKMKHARPAGRECEMERRIIIRGDKMMEPGMMGREKMKWHDEMMEHKGWADERGEMKKHKHGKMSDEDKDADPVFDPELER